MLRLQVTQATGWVDSRNRRRSPLEEFSILDQSARDSLEPGLGASTIVWKLGILSDDWEHPEYTKPLSVGTGVTCHAIGYEAAPQYYDELRPFWLAFLRWLDERDRARLYLLSDQIWGQQDKWIDFGEALVNGELGEMDLRASKSAWRGTYATNATCDELLALIENWWPSTIGMVAGVSLARDTSSKISSGIAERGQLRAADLSSVTQCFETATSYDNLGFVVLTRGEDWASVRDQLDAKGWSDGQPVDLILDRLV